MTRRGPRRDRVGRPDVSHGVTEHGSPTRRRRDGHRAALAPRGRSRGAAARPARPRRDPAQARAERARARGGSSGTSAWPPPRSTRPATGIASTTRPPPSRRDVAAPAPRGAGSGDGFRRDDLVARHRGDRGDRSRRGRVARDAGPVRGPRRLPRAGGGSARHDAGVAVHRRGRTRRRRGARPRGDRRLPRRAARARRAARHGAAPGSSCSSRTSSSRATRRLRSSTRSGRATRPPRVPRRPHRHAALGARQRRRVLGAAPHRAPRRGHAPGPGEVAEGPRSRREPGEALLDPRGGDVDRLGGTRRFRSGRELGGRARGRSLVVRRTPSRWQARSGPKPPQHDGAARRDGAREGVEVAAPVGVVGEEVQAGAVVPAPSCRGAVHSVASPSTRATGHRRPLGRGARASRSPRGPC